MSRLKIKRRNHLAAQIATASAAKQVEEVVEQAVEQVEEVVEQAVEQVEEVVEQAVEPAKQADEDKNKFSDTGRKTYQKK